MGNYSRQREAVLQALKENRIHPTAAEVYEIVQKKLPNISLGTVYRNLSSLCDSGDAIKLNFGNGVERFDAATFPHLHLHCRRCGSITDVPLADNPLADIAAKSGFVMQDCAYVVNGLCKSCKEQENEK